MKFAVEDFGKTEDGKAVSLFTLTNSNGCEIKITNYGGIIVALTVPDRQGNLADVVLGYDKLEDYIKDNPFFGTLVGRYGNRIGAGKFTLNGQKYVLAKNDGPNHLHGGIKGFDKVVWNVSEESCSNGLALGLKYLSRDGEEGYPGNLTVKVVYTWTNTNELIVNYSATTDKTTIVNLTQHSYFNLLGNVSQDILNHQMMINADKFTPVDTNLIPTGEIRPVKGTPLDFTEPTPIGGRIDHDEPQIQIGGGYDHNWVLKSQDGSVALAARVYEPTTGRVMEVLTTEPGIQFYTGNFLDGSHIGKGDIAYQKRFGFCLETQHFPDSPNKPEFPTTVLNPGETYLQTTIYGFSVK